MDRKQASRHRHAGRCQDAQVQRTTLSNGLKVILAERHDTPLVNLWMQVGQDTPPTSLPNWVPPN